MSEKQNHIFEIGDRESGVVLRFKVEGVRREDALTLVKWIFSLCDGPISIRLPGEQIVDAEIDIWPTGIKEEHIIVSEPADGQ
jgi:hypothetical protein